jgi:mitotic spindle assembly checkpoint protein MAD2
MASICSVCISSTNILQSLPTSQLVTSDDQVKAYIKKIMSQLNKWMTGGKISKLVVVITSKETGENVERWQFDVQLFNKLSKKSSKDASKPSGKENAVPTYVLFHFIIGVFPLTVI